MLLTYLWRVHGVDYYAGVENSEMDEESWAAPRPTLRGPRPEEGEKADEADEKKQLAQLEKSVDNVWRARCQDGDPFEAPLQKDKVCARRLWLCGCTCG